MQAKERFIVGYGMGPSIAPNLNQASSFPIIDPITDEFYHYDGGNGSQTRGMYELVLGAERTLFTQALVQAAVAYSQASDYFIKANFLQGADLASADQYRYEYKLSAQQVLAQAKLGYTIHEKTHPYVLGGLGASFNREKKYATTVPPFLTFTREYANKSTSSFAYRFGLGVDYDISPHIRLGAAYRFLNFGNASLGAAQLDDISVPGTLSQTNLHTNEILFQLTYII